MSNQDKIKEIQEGLEKATPGPWNKEGNEVWRRGTGYNNTDGGHIWICDSFNNENAHLIANAPEWLRFLLEEREKMIKVLKFYANEDNWRSSRFVMGRAEADGGEMAQDILDEIGVTVE